MSTVCGVWGLCASSAELSQWTPQLSGSLGGWIRSLSFCSCSFELNTAVFWFTRTQPQHTACSHLHQELRERKICEEALTERENESSSKKDKENGESDNLLSNTYTRCLIRAAILSLIQIYLWYVSPFGAWGISERPPALHCWASAVFFLNGNHKYCPFI